MGLGHWQTSAAALSLFLTLLGLLSLWRLRTILNPKRPKSRRNTSSNDGHRPTHLLIVLGSGGHTAEMIAMLSRATTSDDETLRLDWHRFTHRTWIVSSGDSISADRARQFEDRMRLLAARSGRDDDASSTYDIQTVPRAREIHQPLYTAPVSSMRCLWACIGVLAPRTTQPARISKNDFPDLILCNGPATATIAIFTSVLLRFVDFGGCNSRGKMRTVYVESWARVKKLSLSGLLLSRVVDRFLVQWPQLERAAERAEFVGVLV